MFDDGTFSGQFIGAGVYGYEKDVFQHLRDIEGVAQALSTANYGTFKVLDNNERSYSLYGKALEKEIKNLDLIQKDIDADIRSIQGRIKEFRNSGMRNGKLEVDLTVAKQSYFKMQVDIIKAKVDIFSKAEKNKQEMLKLATDVTNNNTPGTGAIRTDAEGFMNYALNRQHTPNNIMNGGVYPQPVQPTPQAIVRQPMIQTQVVEAIDVPTVQPNPVSDVIQLSQKEELKEPIPEPVVDTTSETITMQEDTNGVQYITNAKGELVPLYSDGPDNFTGENGKYRSTENSLNNIVNKYNANSQLMYKYNKTYKMGWLAMVDKATGQELPYTTMSPKSLHPVDINETDGIATSNRLLEDYPLLITDEVPSEQIQAAYATIKNIEENKNNKEGAPY